MKTELLYDTDLHFEHNQWNNELAFWEDEIKSFNNRLEEIVTRYSDKSKLMRISHFQNQFLLHANIINDIKEQVHAHEMNMADHHYKGINALDVPLMLNHLDFRGKMETQRKMYAELKQDFYNFLSNNIL